MRWRVEFEIPDRTALRPEEPVGRLLQELFGAVRAVNGGLVEEWKEGNADVWNDMV